MMECIEFQKNGVLTTVIGRLSAGFLPFARSQETRLPLRQQSAPQQIEIRQCKRSEQPCRVLRHSAIPDLVEPPKPLHHMEGMLAAGPNLRTSAIDGLLSVGERLALGASAIHAVTHSRLLGTLTMKLAPIGLIAEQFFLFSVLQLRQLAVI